MSTQRYKVFMRHGKGAKMRTLSLYTHAVSPGQAKRFAHVRKPGWSVYYTIRD